MQPLIVGYVYERWLMDLYGGWQEMGMCASNF